MPESPSNKPLLGYSTSLVEGSLVERYDRFIVDVELPDGKVVSAHCVNPGRMEGLVRKGARVWLSPAPEGSKRKLRWTMELIELECGIVGANTIAPNRIAETLVRSRLIPGLKRWRQLETEVRYGENSRIDLMLRGKTDHLVEVKNCHLVYPDHRAYFPDSVSDRASKHLRELVEEVRQGRKASVLFILQRSDGRALRPSDVHDPVFARTAREAADAGVRFRAAVVDPSLDGWRFKGMIPVDLEPYDSAQIAPFREALNDCSGWRRRKKG